LPSSPPVSTGRLTSQREALLNMTRHAIRPPFLPGSPRFLAFLLPPVVYVGEIRLAFGPRAANLRPAVSYHIYLWSPEVATEYPRFSRKPECMLLILQTTSTVTVPNPRYTVRSLLIPLEWGGGGVYTV
jgi:hypothetical protein